MISRVGTVAFEGIEVVPIDVQCLLGNGLPGFAVVGLADKAVAESRERVRARKAVITICRSPWRC